jgi:Domain of unknown function (DUF5658)
METSVVEPSGAVRLPAFSHDPNGERGWRTVLRGPAMRTRFGDIAIVLFLVTQALDGALTYVGLVTFGTAMEGNPLLADLMHAVGEGPALAGAKLVAGAFGMLLHLAAVHRIVALLTAFYLFAAVLPWMVLLFVVERLV